MSLIVPASLQTTQIICSNHLTDKLAVYLHHHNKNMCLTNFQTLFRYLLCPERAVTPDETYLMFLWKLQTENVTQTKTMFYGRTNGIPTAIQHIICEMVGPFSILDYKNLFSDDQTNDEKTDDEKTDDEKTDDKNYYKKKVIINLLKTGKHNSFVQEIIRINQSNKIILHEILCLAIEYSNTIIMEYLLRDMNFDPNKCYLRALPLLIACSSTPNFSGKSTLVKPIRLLVQYGADPYKFCPLNWESSYAYFTRTNRVRAACRLRVFHNQYKKCNAMK